MADVPLNDFGVDHQPLCDVLQGAEDDVCCQEGLRQGDPPAHERGGEMSKYIQRNLKKASAWSNTDNEPRRLFLDSSCVEFNIIRVSQIW